MSEFKLTNLITSSIHPVAHVGNLFSGVRDFQLKLADKFDIKTPGFYFIVVGGVVKHVSHAGIQKRQIGFREVLNRLNSPRTLQNGEFSRQLAKDLSTTVVKVYHMSYAAVRATLQIDEYSAQNNGLHMLTMLRDKYTISGRSLS